ITSLYLYRVCSSLFAVPAATAIYTLSLHDALPIFSPQIVRAVLESQARSVIMETFGSGNTTTARWFLDLINEAIRNGKNILNISDRKSTRLNSSHVKISYAVFCLKKKSKQQAHYNR